MQKDFENFVTKHNREVEGLNVKISELALTAENKSQVINQQNDIYWELRKELDTANGKAVRDVALLEKEKEGLEAEIVKLKAKMFDMQEKINWLEEHTDYDSIQED